MFDILRKYGHANLKLSLHPEIEFKAISDESDEVNWKSPAVISPTVPFLNGAFNIGLEVAGFVDIKAEAGIEYNVGSEYFSSIEWFWENGQHRFTDLETHRSLIGDIEQKAEAHLDGELYLGGCADLTLNTLFQIAGAGIEVKFGPKIEAEFSLGVLDRLSGSYDRKAYGKAHLDISAGLKTETYCYYRNLMHPDVLEKIKLPFGSEFFTEPFSVQLFPEFNSKAALGRSTAQVVQSQSAPEAVSVSTFTETSLPYPLDVDFEIADKSSDAMIATTEVDAFMESGVDDAQNLSAEIVIPAQLGKIDKDNIVARPVINYKDRRVKAPAVQVAGDIGLCPVVVAICGGGAYFVSGAPPVHQIDYDDDTYIEGNLIGLQTGDRRHRKRSFSTVDFVDLSDLADYGAGVTLHPLIGEWSGEIGSESVRFKFIDNANGEYNGMSFSYRYNAPLRGGIAIVLKGGTISFSVIEISDDSMTIIMKGCDTKTVLSRI